MTADELLAELTAGNPDPDEMKKRLFALWPIIRNKLRSFEEAEVAAQWARADLEDLRSDYNDVLARLAEAEL